MLSSPPRATTISLAHSASHHGYGLSVSNPHLPRPRSRSPSPAPAARGRSHSSMSVRQAMENSAFIGFFHHRSHSHSHSHTQSMSPPSSRSHSPASLKSLPLHQEQQQQQQQQAGPGVVTVTLSPPRPSNNTTTTTTASADGNIANSTSPVKSPPSPKHRNPAAQPKPILRRNDTSGSSASDKDEDGAFGYYTRHKPKFLSYNVSSTYAGPTTIMLGASQQKPIRVSRMLSSSNLRGEPEEAKMSPLVATKAKDDALVASPPPTPTPPAQFKPLITSTELKNSLKTAHTPPRINSILSKYYGPDVVSRVPPKFISSYSWGGEGGMGGGFGGRNLLLREPYEETLKRAMERGVDVGWFGDGKGKKGGSGRKPPKKKDSTSSSSDSPVDYAEEHNYPRIVITC